MVKFGWKTQFGSFEILGIIIISWKRELPWEKKVVKYYSNVMGTNLEESLVERGF